MVTCSAGAGSGRRRTPPIRRRFAAACVVSVLAHVFLAKGIATGPPRSSSVAATPVIAARLAAPPVAAPGARSAELETPTEPLQPPPPAERVRTPSTEPVHAAKIEPDPGASAGIARALDASYYAARELDVYPALKAPLELRPAPHAPAAGMRGGALLLVLIDAHGNVDEVSIVEAEPRGNFEEDARRALLTARFTPALKNGRAVKSRLLIRVDHGGEGAAP